MSSKASLLNILHILDEGTTQLVDFAAFCPVGALWAKISQNRVLFYQKSEFSCPLKEI